MLQHSLVVLAMRTLAQNRGMMTWCCDSHLLTRSAKLKSFLDGGLQLRDEVLQASLLKL